MASSKKTPEVTETPKAVPEYFYTTNYPHKWGNGPIVRTFDPKSFAPIKSLDEAKALAEKYRVYSTGDDACTTTYGVQYRV